MVSGTGSVDVGENEHQYRSRFIDTSRLYGSGPWLNRRKERREGERVTTWTLVSYPPIPRGVLTPVFFNDLQSCPTDPEGDGEGRGC